MNPDGSGQRLLAHEAGLGWDISWSPDGRELAPVGGPGGLYAVSADGSGKRLLTRKATGLGFDWASDGTIAFGTIRGGYRDIWLMNADGTNQRNLTRDIPQQAFGIAWSPTQPK
jgi:Tol biopolymer transport system component